MKTCLRVPTSSVSKNLSLLVALAALLWVPMAARAVEPIRSVQEELRKRKLYFGDVDGRQTPSFIDAVKKYQERKGFPVTGQTDPDTLQSMGISAPEAVTTLPDVPVLRSDRSMNPARAVANAPAVSQPRPTNAPPPTRAEMIAWVRRYLEACQTPDPSDELAYYAEQVDYFHHGTVRKEDIGRELAAYAQQWPTRRYWISGPVRLDNSGENTVVRSRISFELESAGGTRQAAGKVDNAFILARRADLSWEIIGHEEERVRQATARGRNAKRRSSEPALSPVERTLRKFFGSGSKKSTKSKKPKKRTKR